MWMAFVGIKHSQVLLGFYGTKRYRQTATSASSSCQSNRSVRHAAKSHALATFGHVALSRALRMAVVYTTIIKIKVF